MFVLSVRSSGIKLFLVIALCLLVLFFIFLGNSVALTAGSGEVDFSGINKKEDRIAFLSANGIEVDAESESSVNFVLPESFDRALAGYNEIQRAQGLDLSKYARKKITRYTYELTNPKEGEEGAVANLLIYRGRIVGCDISSKSPDGFVRGIVGTAVEN